MSAVIDLPAAQQRSQHRDAARDIRANAGIASDARTIAVAEIGAAARRLRQSNRWNDSVPLRTQLAVVQVSPVRVITGPIRGFDHDDATPHAIADTNARRDHPAGCGLPRRLHSV